MHLSLKRYALAGTGLNGEVVSKLKFAGASPIFLIKTVRFDLYFTGHSENEISSGMSITPFINIKTYL
jgi:hypothetical protein